MQRTLALRDEPQLAAERVATEAGREHADRLFRQHGRFVARVLLRLGVAERDVQDVCQEVFLTVLRRHEQWLGTSRETTWLYGVCLRLAANHRRKAHRRYERPALDESPAVESEAIEQQLDARRLMHELDAALDHISAKKRDVFVLYEFAERDMEEVSAILGVPLKTCYSRLYAARTELQTALGKREVAP